MTRHIERQIETLKERILRVGTLVEEAISKSITALINRDLVLARRVMANDDEIDRMEVEVEEECLKILALYQPVATDLSQLAGSKPYELPPEIRTMAMQAEEMVKECLDAVVKRDPALARQVREEDDVVDDARQKVQRRVMQAIKDDPDSVENLLRINSVSKHIERIADMATNIAEDVVYMVEGDIVRHRAES
jgi:phosphate transport system protein